MRGLLENLPLAGRTTFEVGGPARFYLEVKSVNELGAALAWADARALPVEILGGGSNVVIADRGLGGLVVRVAIDGIIREGEAVEVGAGVRWDDFARWAVDHDLAGVECLAGIPGDVGAAPLQNVGAYGQEVASSIEAVHCLRRSDGREVTLSAAECEFGYRDSVFKRASAGRYIIVGVRFRLKRGGEPTVAYAELERALGTGKRDLAEVRQTVIALRRAKSMVLDPDDENRRSAGSFFVNPTVSREEADAAAARTSAPMPRFDSAGRVKIPAAWLIEHSGLGRGSRRGRVGLSSRHCLALVNHGGATASELVDFAAEVRGRVREAFGIALSPEPRLIGFEHAELRALAD
jgi:UDP-N-acetylmuramate dehydrogenase